MCVCPPSEWVFSDHTEQKFHKETHSFWGVFCIDLYTYLKHHYAQQSLCPFPGHFNESSCESGEKPCGGILFFFFLRGQWFRQSLFIPEKHFVKMKSILKWGGRVPGALPGNFERSCFSHPWGACPLAGRDVSTCVWERRLTLPVTGGQGRVVGKMVRDEPVSPPPQKDSFIISPAMLGTLSSSSCSSCCM